MIINMKKTIVSIVMMLVSSMIVAQSKKSIHIGKYTLSDVTVSSGKTAITSGLDTKVDFTHIDSNRVMFVLANADRIMVNVGKKWNKFTYIQSFGQFKNIPWTGPMFIVNMGPVDVTVWHGFGLSKDKTLKEPGLKPNFFFSYEGVGVKLPKNSRINASVIWFTTNKMNWFVGYKKTVLIGEKAKIFGEITYNHNENIPMFVVGYTFKVK